MVKNRSEFENIINPEVLDLIDKYHKHFTNELSMNITVNVKTLKFNIGDYFNILKKINIDFQKELADKTKTK
tara:strand:+ start:2835 stop:3050 length:216 start_codon:yes stop_codon:yes gene_type:complete